MVRLKNFLVGMIFLVVGVFTLGDLYASPPATMSYQGFLTDGVGLAKSGSFDMTFRLYPTETGGSHIWEETIPAVTVAKGVFQVILGKKTPMGGIAFDQTYYLGLAVGSDPEMVPRSVLTSTPYAMRALKDADTLGGLSLICQTGQTVQFDGAGWVCAGPQAVNQTASYPIISKVEPLTANLGISTTFTVTGANLTKTNILDVPDCGRGSLTGPSTSMTFTCTPRTVGIKAGEIKVDDYRGGVLKTFNVNVTVLSGRFVNNGNGTVTDTTSGLILLQNPGCFSSMKWQNAMDAAAMLANGKCGLTDGSSVGQWRLPSFYGELDVLYYAKDDTAFTGVQKDIYWSRTASSNTAHVINLFNGNSSSNLKGDIDNYVWPVRGAQ